jgi:hypothetical protein
MNSDIAVEVQEDFQGYAQAAVMRLQYLFPAWEISVKPGAIEVRNIQPSTEAEALREVAYALYRERIRSEGAALRELLLTSVMA